MRDAPTSSAPTILPVGGDNTIISDVTDLRRARGSFPDQDEIVDCCAARATDLAGAIADRNTGQADVRPTAAAAEGGGLVRPAKAFSVQERVPVGPRAVARAATATAGVARTAVLTSGERVARP